MLARFAPPSKVKDIECGIVYREPAALGGWPFLNRFWETRSGDYIVASKKTAANCADPKSIKHDEIARSSAKITTVRSCDRGRTWGSEIIIRDGGGSWDLAYACVTEPEPEPEPEPGEIPTVNFVNTKDDPVQQNCGIRYLAWSRMRT